MLNVIESVCNNVAFRRVPRLMADDPEISSVPLWEKYSLTCVEAAKVFNIGEKKLRQIAEDNIGQPDSFVLMNGTKLLLKRERLAEFLDKTESI